MKLAKMSMVAALLLGANAYAIDNVKVNGSASIFYGTEDASVKDAVNTPDMFDKDASYADAAVKLGVTADLSEGISAGATFQAVSTLGLENNLVSGVWSGGHDASATSGASFPTGTGGVQVDDASWFSEAWIAGTAGKTTAKLGRQALDTPLAFTETWSITDNTFEAAVLINQDLPDTTLIGAWIGKSNGIGEDSWNGTPNLGFITSAGGKFNTFAKDGAYAIAAINNSFEPLTAQAWYYELPSLASAYWLQADLDMEGILAGAQYVDIDLVDSGVNAVTGLTGSDYKNDRAYGLMLGYAMKDVATFKVAYSAVDDEGTIGVSNLATYGASSGAQSKLYTEMWWWYGTVSQTGADTLAISAETTVGDGYDLYLGYWTCDIEPKGQVAGDQDSVDEIAFTVSKSYGPLDTSVALIHDEFDYKGGATSGDDESLTTLQVYLTYNF